MLVGVETVDALTVIANSFGFSMNNCREWISQFHTTYMDEATCIQALANHCWPRALLVTDASTGNHTTFMLGLGFQSVSAAGTSSPSRQERPSTRPARNSASGSALHT